MGLHETIWCCLKVGRLKISLQPPSFSLCKRPCWSDPPFEANKQSWISVDDMVQSLARPQTCVIWLKRGLGYVCHLLYIPLVAMCCIDLEGVVVPILWRRETPPIWHHPEVVQKADHHPITSWFVITQNDLRIFTPENCLAWPAISQVVFRKFPKLLVNILLILALHVLLNRILQLLVALEASFQVASTSIFKQHLGVSINGPP